MDTENLQQRQKNHFLPHAFKFVGANLGAQCDSFAYVIN